MTRTLSAIEAAIPRCRRCTRLVEYCAAVAREKRRAFADEVYWGRPVPGFGDPSARIWIIGLAPAAHGANRTGRMFTGDRSGDFLYAALHRAGLAREPHSRSKDDGQALRGVYISASARCAPPGNKLEREELERCAPFLEEESRALSKWRVVLCLGAVAWGAALRLLEVPAPRPKFAHAAESAVGERLVLGSYHVSQQNTFTGKLTPAMFDAVLARAAQFARLRVRGS